MEGIKRPPKERLINNLMAKETEFYPNEAKAL